MSVSGFPAAKVDLEHIQQKTESGLAWQKTCNQPKHVSIATCGSAIQHSSRQGWLLNQHDLGMFHEKVGHQLHRLAVDIGMLNDIRQSTSH
jgi:primosomal replication protein N